MQVVNMYVVVNPRKRCVSQQRVMNLKKMKFMRDGHKWTDESFVWLYACVRAVYLCTRFKERGPTSVRVRMVAMLSQPFEVLDAALCTSRIGRAARVLIVRVIHRARFF